jgi:hypothetical protein
MISELLQAELHALDSNRQFSRVAACIDRHLALRVGQTENHRQIGALESLVRNRDSDDLKLVFGQPKLPDRAIANRNPNTLLIDFSGYEKWLQLQLEFEVGIRRLDQKF